MHSPGLALGYTHTHTHTPKPAGKEGLPRREPSEEAGTEAYLRVCRPEGFRSRQQHPQDTNEISAGGSHLLQSASAR